MACGGAEAERTGPDRTGPTSRYGFPANASRSNAASSKRCSSVRCVCLFPVAGAAAGSRPAYLCTHTHTHTHTEMSRRATAARRSYPNFLPDRASSPDGARPADGGSDARLHVVVVALVLVLLLAPNQIGVRVAIGLRLHQVEGERRELGKVFEQAQ